MSTDDARRLVDRAADWGFDSVELPLEDLSDWDSEAVGESLGASGVRATVCAVMSPGRELCGTDAATAHRTRDYLVGCVEKAAEIGATLVGGPMYSSVGRTWRTSEDERAHLILELQTNLSLVLKRTAELGVSLAIEPLNRYETSLINTVEQGLELVSVLNPSQCGLLFDTFHANIEERSVADGLDAAGGRLVHVQASASHRGTPGDDHIDWPAFARALRTIDYRGTVTIESFTRENDAIATAASIWRDLAPSPDDLALGGLATLRTAWAGL